MFAFLNGDLLPHLRGLRDRPRAAPRQKLIGEIMSGVERTRIDTELNFLDVLDRLRHGGADRRRASQQALLHACSFPRWREASMRRVRRRR